MARERSVREPTQRRSKEKKARIIKAARRMISEEGFDAANTNKIAKTAGVSVGALYAYFRNKRDILMEIIDALRDETFKESERDLGKMLEGANDFKAVLDGLIRSMKASHEKDKRLHREIIIQSFKDREIHERYYGDDVRGDEYVKYYFSLFPDQLEVDDVEAAVFLIKYAIDDCIHHLVFDPEPPVDDDRVLKQLLKMLCRYLARE